ncbi:unnamed protein product [Protopolystoma xenopodis]|uniref:Uncharacterized protein n=1 Tax=Protopolystoma xenopodis TaxID=117903 RepID=A0A448XGS2_9PLAT|nr:unnamed protein product [Protopolystoma xenopodis]
MGGEMQAINGSGPSSPRTPTNCQYAEAVHRLHAEMHHPGGVEITRHAAEFLSGVAFVDLADRVCNIAVVCLFNLFQFGNF